MGMKSLNRPKVEERFYLEVLYSDGSVKRYEDLNMEGLLAEVYIAMEYIIKGKEPKIKQLILKKLNHTN
ncbi:MAG: hypothetical protein QXU47_07025 [Candidatus Bathyarchaeia archaeon]